MNDQSGFSLIDILIALAIIGVLVTSVHAAYNSWTGVARLERCAVTMEMLASDITTYEMQQRDTLTKAQVDWYMPLPENYWYVPNNVDHNKGHGNDLDGCDEENPGESINNRECIPMRWLILCNHDHSGEGVDYMFRIDGMVPRLVPNSDSTDLPFLRDAAWWLRKDPNFDKWWGR